MSLPIAAIVPGSVGPVAVDAMVDLAEAAAVPKDTTRSIVTSNSLAAIAICLVGHSAEKSPLSADDISIKWSDVVRGKKK